MSIQRRTMIMGALLVSAAILYGVARRHSSVLVYYVVEQSLLQKAPSGVGRDELRTRLHRHLSTSPDERARIEKLLRISQRLEKVQHLTVEDLDDILGGEKVGRLAAPGCFSPGIGNFSRQRMSE